MKHQFAKQFSTASAILYCAVALLLIPVNTHAQSFSVISAGGEHSLALKSDRSLWAWGANNAGQLGDGSAVNCLLPKRVGEEFIAIAAGSAHSLGIKADGTLWAWGWNGYGQLGDGAKANRVTPVQVGEGYISVAAGDKHSLALKEDGSLWAWGSNDFGQLGDDTKTERHTPVQVGEGFTAVAAGYRHSLGLKADGTLWHWGEMGNNVIFPTGLQVDEGFMAIAVGGTNSLGLKVDGTLWTCRVPPVQIGEGFATIAAGASHSLGLKADGTLWAWGSNEYGQVGDDTTTTSKPPVQVGEGFSAISGGGGHSLGLKSDGTLWAWGKNNAGQLGTGSTVPRAIPVRVGGGFAYYVPYAPDAKDFGLSFGIFNSFSNDAEIWVEYFSNDGVKLGEENKNVPAGGHLSFMSEIGMDESGWARVASSEPLKGMALALGYGEDPLFDMDFKASDRAFKELTAPHVDIGDGWASKAMLANPNNSAAAVTVTFKSESGLGSQTADLTIPGWGAVQYDLGGFGSGTGTLGISSDQGLVGFLLYDGRAKSSHWATGLSLVPASPPRCFKAIFAGFDRSFGLESDGTLWAWGGNAAGKLGDGTTTMRTTPVRVGENFATVAVGGAHSLGVKTDGTLWSWGWNYYGQLGDGTLDNHFVPVQVGEGFAAVAAGDKYSLGLKTDGTIWTWGYDLILPLEEGTTRNYHTPVLVGKGFAAISAGFNRSYGLKTDGTLWGWGDNNGFLGDGTWDFQAVPVLIGEGYSAISAGHYHALAIKTEGSLWGWGWRLYGSWSFEEQGHPHRPMKLGEGFTSVAGGGSHSLALQTGGLLWSWGRNWHGQLGIGSQEPWVSTQPGSSIKPYYRTPQLIGEGFSTIAAGEYHSLGLKADGSLWTWGCNEDGQLGDGSTEDHLIPTPVSIETTGLGGEYAYFFPYTPDNEDFDLGFGIANLDSAAADVTVEYYSNDGAFLGRETAAIQPYGQTSFMCGVALDESGWARVISSQPLYGMALGIGYGDDPLFDMDFKPATAANLIAAHVDTRNGWVSKAMLANPNNVQADVTVTFYPDDGLNIQTAGLTIPAMGAVQYDLATAFPNASGAIKVASDQGLVGFLLYDGRGVSGDFSGFNYVGGLSMVEAD